MIQSHIYKLISHIFVTLKSRINFSICMHFIENFVEIKNALEGEGAKMSSYCRELARSFVLFHFMVHNMLCFVSGFLFHFSLDDLENSVTSTECNRKTCFIFKLCVVFGTFAKPNTVLSRSF